MLCSGLRAPGAEAVAGTTTCGSLSDFDTGVMGLQAHTQSRSREDKKTATYTVQVSTTIATSAEPGLTGYGGDVFVSPVAVVKFAEVAEIFVPIGACAARRFDKETWSLVGKSADTDGDGVVSDAEKVGQIGVTERVLADTQSGQGISSSLTSAAVSRKTDALFAKSDAAWNSIAVHSLADILIVRLPSLEVRKFTFPWWLLVCAKTDSCLLGISKLLTGQERNLLRLATAGLHGGVNHSIMPPGASQARKNTAQEMLRCHQSWDANVCPPIEVLAEPDQSAVIQEQRVDITNNVSIPPPPPRLLFVALFCRHLCAA